MTTKSKTEKQGHYNFIILSLKITHAFVFFFITKDNYSKVFIILKTLTFFSTITTVTSTVVSCMLVWNPSGIFRIPQQHTAELTVFLWDLYSDNSKGTQRERFYCAGSPSNSIPFSKRLIPCFITSWCFADSPHWNCSCIAFCKFLKTECVWFHRQGMFPYFEWQKMKLKLSQ